MLCCSCVVTQSCLTLNTRMDCGPPGSSLHGVLQARILEWVTISFSRDLPIPGIEPKSLRSPALAGRFFSTSATNPFPQEHRENKPQQHSSQRRQWQPTPVLLPGKSHGRRSLVGSSPWGRKESDMTEPLHFHFSLSCIGEGNGNPLQCSCLENPRDWGA